MSIETLFRIELVGGYVAWLLVYGAWMLPWLGGMDRPQAHRVMAALHAFRFFGLAFILPGFVGHLPPGFAVSAAYGDFTAGVLAMLALAAFRVRPLFWGLVLAFNVVGVGDLVINYVNATRLNVPAMAGEFGASLVIPVLYVPILMITHVTALWWLARRSPQGAARLTSPATAGSR